MKKILQLILFFAFSSNISAQDINFNISKTYIYQFGKNSDLIGFCPLFKLNSDAIHNKVYSAKIKHLPKSINISKIAYGFLYFKGLKNSSFENELVLLVENYETSNPIIYVDSNGNLDFTDDGKPYNLKEISTLKLANSEDSSANYNYQIAKSKISEENEHQIRNKYASKFPKSNIISADKWLTTQRLFVRMSKEKINNKAITIFLIDNSADGLFNFQTNENGDRILIVEGEVDINKDLTFLFRQAQPIDHNAIFELYGKSYYPKTVSINGDGLTITETSENTRVFYKDGQDISSLNIELLNGCYTTIKDLIKENKYLLIDFGGTWCGGCISQEPTIKAIYESGKAEVIGFFVYDTPESVGKYIKEHNIKWPVALVNSDVKNMFNFNSYPTYILISSEGKIILGDINSEQIVKYLEKY